MPLAFPKSDSLEIREVWDDNLEQEFALIREIVHDYPYVGLDTEYPGVVCKSVTECTDRNERNYLDMRANVAVLKLIQLGLTFADENGNLPKSGTDKKHCVWQFNFREFNRHRDPHANDSINMLKESRIDFDKFAAKGVRVTRFRDLLISSGAVSNDEIRWVTFHGSYDFGFLIKLLTGENLPESQGEFFELVKVLCPNVYDVKHMVKSTNSLHGGLSKVAGMLGVERIGRSHQGGSDSLLTVHTFLKMKESCFGGLVEKFEGVVYSLGVEM